MRRPALLSTLTCMGAVALVAGCPMQRVTDESSASPTSMVTTPADPVIEAPPDHLRGRVALPAGARLYARPSYTGSSWVLTLSDPPLGAINAPPRARAFRVIGIVRDATAGDFVAVTNDLRGEDQDTPRGCGPAIAGLDHLRLLLYVPLVYLAEVSTRSLSLELHSPAGEREWVEIGAGARVGPPTTQGMPAAASGVTWRWIDADGIRVIAPVPDDAIARVWDPGQAVAPTPAGDPLMRDADGSIMWLRDEGEATVELTVRNDCGDYRRVVEDPAEIESLRALALDVFYDQSPASEAQSPASLARADFRVSAQTPLRWPDGALAGEVLEDWRVEVGVGQTWDNRRCFALILGDELVPLDEPGLACVSPQALEPLGEGEAPVSFGVHDAYELGGSVELGPAEVGAGPWTDDELRAVFNRHHDSSAECLRPMLEGRERFLGGRWVLDLRIDEAGRVEQVELAALGPSVERVEDCLRAEAYTWVFRGGDGQLRVPITVGTWDGDEVVPLPALDLDPADEPGPPDNPPDSAPDEPRERGKVTVIRDEE